MKNQNQEIKTNYYFVFFVLIFSILFLTYMIVPTFWGADTYGFYLKYCLGKPSLINNVPFLSNLIFESWRCSVLSYKILMTFIFIVWVLILKKTLELFKPENVWKNMCVLFAFLPLLQYFFQLEDDNFGYLLMALSSYFMIKGLIKKSRINMGFGVLLVLISGLLFWRGSILFLFNYSFVFLPATGLFLMALFFISFQNKNPFGSSIDLVSQVVNNLIKSLFPALDPHNKVILENTFGLSTIFLLLLFVFFPSIPKELIILSAIFLIMSFFSLKWMLYCVVFLMIGSIFNKVYVNRFTILIAGLTFLIYNSILFTTILPNSNDWNVIQEAKELSMDLNMTLKGDWSHGYWLLYQGVNTPYFGGFPEKYDLNHSVVLTTDLNLNCPIYKRKFNTLIYICP